MCRLELDKTQLYFTAFQPPAVHWSSTSSALTSSPPPAGQKYSVTSSTTGTYCYMHTPIHTVQPCTLFSSLLAVVGLIYQLRFKSSLTLAEDSERRPTLAHSALLIKLPLLEMSGLGCVIPFNCYSMTVGRCECVFRGEREKEIEEV